jgi:anti-sigma factor RsiW
MTDCPNGDVRDALPDYLTDRLDPTRRRAVEAHLASCAVCREELSVLRALRATMHRAPAVDVGAIAASIPPYRAPVRRGWATRARVAAAIVLVAVGGTSIAVLRARTAVSPVAPVQPMAVAPSPPAPSPDTELPGPVRPSTPEPVAAVARPAAGAASTRELAIGGGSIADLSDQELSALVEGIESLDGVPSPEVEAPEPVLTPVQEGT